MTWFGGIEAGGTKFNCIIAQDPDHILAETTIPTRTPVETLTDVVEFFNTNTTKSSIQLSAIGLACFGPINLDQNEPKYGMITSTPKLQWRNTPILSILQEKLQLPIAFDTDVNGAALGEGRWGAGVGISDFIYITIGTGIGGGIIVNGSPLHGLIHPEIGHMLLNHNLSVDPFEGHCPYHKDCFEGLAAGPAVSARWGISTHEMPPEHPAWNLEAQYIAQAIHNLCLILSPKRIILGGGIMKIPGLLDKVHQYTPASLNGYIDSELITKNIKAFIVPPSLGDRSGSLGAIAMAASATSS